MADQSKQISIESPWGKVLGLLKGESFFPYSGVIHQWWKSLTSTQQRALIPGIVRPQPPEPKKRRKRKHPRLLSPKPWEEYGFQPEDNPYPRVFDLSKAFSLVNQHYFSYGLEEPSLRWGRRYFGKRRGITYGYYEDRENRITMNPILKEDFVPYEVFEFILYHEMLHMICEGEWRKRGREKIYMIHTPEFKRFEKLHPCYKTARKWLDDHLDFMLNYYRRQRLRK